MSILNDTDFPVYSDEWWAGVLRRKLRERNDGREWAAGRQYHDFHSQGQSDSRPGLTMLWDYLRGEPPLPRCSEDWGADTYPFLRLSRMNYAEMIVGSATDRIVAMGWHTSEDDDPDGDKIAAEIAAENDFDEAISDVATWMLALGEGYMLVGPMDSDIGVPNITAEDPRSAITAKDPSTRRVLMGYKSTIDEWTNQPLEYLYGPGWVRRRLIEKNGVDYRWLGDRTYLPGHGNRVPLIPFTNRDGVGDYERHLDVLDRINDGIFTRVSLAKYQAFRQRAFENLPDFDEDGAEIEYTPDMFRASPGSAWRLPEGTKIWESMANDLTPVRMAIKDDVEGLFSVTRTPLHYVAPEAAQGSAEGASMQKEAHVFRVEDRRRRMANGLAKVLSLAFMVTGDTNRAKVSQIKTIWTPIERYSLTAKWSAAVQAKDVGYPFDEIMTEIVQHSPSDLPRINAQRDEDLLYDPAAAGMLESMSRPLNQAAEPQVRSGGKPSAPARNDALGMNVGDASNRA